MRLDLRARLRRGGTRGRQQPGQALIEMALVIMILLTLTFGIADAGLYMYDFVQAANCTREAARRAAVRQDPTNIPFCPASSSLQPVVAYADSSKAAGTDVTATIDKTHRWIAICYFVPGMSCTAPLRSATTMRMEGAKL